MARSRLHWNALYFMSAQVFDRGSYAVLLAELTYFFGIGPATDVFFVALAIPTMVVNITMDGCFVAVLRALSKTDDEQQRWAVIGQSLVLFGTIYSAIAAVIVLGAGVLVSITAPGLAQGTRSEAILLLRIAATMIPAQGLGQVVSSAFIKRERVALGALRSAAVSGLSLLIAFGGTVLLGARIETFLCAVVAGTWVVNLVYVVGLMSVKGRHSLNLGFRKDIAEIFMSGLMNSGNNIPTNITLLFERAIATLMGPGMLSAINLARVAMNIVAAPSAAVANSSFVDAMIVPVGKHDHEQGRRLATMLYGPLLVAAPILAVLLMDSSTVVGFLFEHGHASGGNVYLVSRLLLILIASFPFQICGTALLRMYQTAHMEKWFLIVLSAGTVGYAVAAAGLGQMWGVEGLAATYSVSFDLVTLTLVAVAVHQLGIGRDLAALPWWQLATASACSYAVVFLRCQVLPPLQGQLEELLVTGAISVFSYLLAGWTFDLPGVRPALRRILSLSGSL